MRIYVGNLGAETSEDELRAIFTPHGRVSGARLAKDKDTGALRGFGIVLMEEAPGRTAIAALQGAQLSGRKLRVKEAKPKRFKPENGGASPTLGDADATAARAGPSEPDHDNENAAARAALDAAVNAARIDRQIENARRADPRHRELSMGDLLTRNLVGGCPGLQAKPAVVPAVDSGGPGVEPASVVIPDAFPPVAEDKKD